jgi:hypothetical protein
MKRIISIERIGFVTGLITSAALIAYFLLMKVLNLAHVVELRFFNVIIVAVGIIYGIVRLKRNLHEDEFYLKGLGQGMFITAVTTVIFALFITVYLTYFDHQLMMEIRSRVSYKGSIDGTMIFVSVFMEGMASGAIITFAAMQYLKVQGTVKRERHSHHSYDRP